ncbi:hypothetical protein E1B28_012423 [Marasmius oreades]|uniref:Uncharacterized protein n=1 Tax=Marasmius oreades TaxID=181124 RepID=A0A9P7UNY4_9AGAR|nr:uncharacterized protein E1B28_012423 [Marasmius oreades]KAG7088430.1 hypothetical protein E1B28_012423 [Marasmius oreades]
MEQLCNEVLQLIFYELQEPTSLTLVSKRFYEFSQDPYFRAHYFLSRYGPAHALYHALGRGKVLTERVLDILITSGAHFSRYLIQVAIHHYFHTQSHFIKTQWVRSVSLPVFTHFLQLASRRYDHIPRGKGQDDGSIFAQFLSESRYPPSQKRVSWENIRVIIEEYHFFPFCNKDPIMAQFPLVLAIEPRLLPYAVANGFYMDSKYRDFVFRKMFEYAAASDRRPEDIVQNFEELSRLDSTMFLTRTVAAEICVEAKVNRVGYTALKQLDTNGRLRFSLSSLVEDLLKLFLKTRSVTTLETQTTIRFLYKEFPSSDPTVRLVVLLTVFMAADVDNLITVKVRLEDLNIGPLKKEDVYNLLVHPLMDRCTTVFDYMRSEMASSEDAQQGLGAKEIQEVIDNVAARLLEVDCKGRMLERLHDSYPSVNETIIRTVLTKHRIELEDLPKMSNPATCRNYRPSLCREHHYKGSEMDYFWDTTTSTESQVAGDNVEDGSVGKGQGASRNMNEIHVRELGEISQESLTIMIRQDELLPSRNRRRMSYFSAYSDLGLFNLPIDYSQVGRWIKAKFGARNIVTAIFMTHAVLNNASSILRHYLMEAAPVPLTLKHFQILARLGRPINYNLTLFLLTGPEFYHCEDEYLVHCDATSNTLSALTSDDTKRLPALSAATNNSRSTGRKRPRRSAANMRTYVIADSDEEKSDLLKDCKHPDSKEIKQVLNLETWIQELGKLLRVEQSRFRQRKKNQCGNSSDAILNEFMKSLGTELRILRKHSREKNVSHNEVAIYDDGDDGEYVYRETRLKRTRTTR